jgi:hypothetical protein
MAACSNRHWTQFGVRGAAYHPDAEMYSVLPRVPVKLETAVVCPRMQRHQFAKFRPDLPHISRSPIYFLTFSSSKRVLVDIGSFGGRVR